MEPACGASLSMVYDQVEVLKNYKNIVVEVCGGANTTLEKLLAYKKQFGLEE